MDARPHIHKGWTVRLTVEDLQKALEQAGASLPPMKLGSVVSHLNVRLNPPITAQPIQECVKVWEETLAKFNAARPILPAERAAIGRAIQACENDPEPVKLALFGARHEKGSEGFNPAQYLSVHRILDAKNFPRLMSIGAQERAKRLPQQKQVDLPSVTTSRPAAFQSTQEALEKTEMTPEARAVLQAMKKRGFLGG